MTIFNAKVVWIKDFKNCAADLGMEAITNECKSFPEAKFTILNDEDNVQYGDFKMPDEYIQYVKKSQEELNLDVEYELDLQDIYWLENINEAFIRDGFVTVSKELMEKFMDMFEKLALVQVSLLYLFATCFT